MNYKNKIEIYNGVDIDPNFTDRIIVRKYPSAVAPTLTLTGAAAGGVLLNGLTYYYAASCVGVNGESKISNEISQAITTGGDNSVEFTMTSATGISVYRIYRGTSTGVYDGFMEISNTSATVTVIDAGNFILKTPIMPVPTADPLASYSTIRKSDILSVVPIFMEATIVDDLPKASQTKVSLVMRDGHSYVIDLKLVVNQSTWSTGDENGVMLAVEMLNDWVI
jgi:hypothetical protein